jgi:hypothetical protein
MVLRLLAFFLPGRHDDAVLGTLTRGWGCWRGRIAFGGGEAVPLVLAGWGSAPNSARLGLARDLVARYEALRPAIERALYEHYGQCDEAEEPLPRLGGADEVWAHVSAVRVLIERMVGRETVEIAYRAAWDEEHTLGARFQDWALVELNGSVRA